MKDNMETFICPSINNKIIIIRYDDDENYTNEWPHQDAPPHPDESSGTYMFSSKRTHTAQTHSRDQTYM